MQIVELQNGDTIEFPDGMPEAEINAEVEKFLATGPVPALNSGKAPTEVLSIDDVNARLRRNRFLSVDDMNSLLRASPETSISAPAPKPHIVRLPDGRRIRFPGDMTNAQMTVEVEKFLAEESAAAPEPQSPPFAGTPTTAPTPRPPVEGLSIFPRSLEQAKRGFQLGVQNAGGGLARLAGTPADISTMVANLPLQFMDTLAGALNEGVKSTTGKNPDFGIDFRFPTSPLGSEAISSAAGGLATRLGVPPIKKEDQSSGERMVGNIVSFATEALGGATALARTAAKRALTDGARAAPRLSDAILRPYQTGSARPVVGDVAAGAGSGAALSAVDDLLPEKAQGPITDTIAMLLGGVGGGTAANIIRSPKRIVNAITDRAITDTAIPVDPDSGLSTSRRVADRTAEAVQGPVRLAGKNPAETAANIGRQANEFRHAGGPMPTVGAMSDDIGLQALEKGARRRDPIPFQVRDQALRDSALENVENLRKPGDPMKATAFAEREAGAQRAVAQRGIDEVEGKLSVVRDARGAAGDALAAQRGQGASASTALDRSVRDTLETESRRSSDLFRSIDPDGTVVLDASPMAGLVDDIRKSVPRTVPEGEVLPESFLRQFERVAGREKVDTGLLDASGNPITRQEGGTVTFKELNEARPFLASEIKKAQKANEFGLAKNLRALKSYVDDTVEDLAASGNPAGRRASDALENFKVRFAPRFREGEGGKFAKDIRTDQFGTQTLPSETAGRFLSRVESAADLANILQVAKNPAAGHRAARQFIMDKVSNVAVGEDGKINGNRLAKWRDNHKGVLKQIPTKDGKTLLSEIDETIRNARQGAAKETDLARDLKAATRAADLTETQIRKSAAGLLLDEDPTKAAATVLSAGPNLAPRKMAEIKDLVRRDPEALAGWKRAVSDHLVESVTEGDGALSVTKLQKAFRAHEKTLIQIYGPEEMMALRQAHKMVEPLAKMSQGATLSVQGAKNEQLWNSLEAGLLGVTGNAITTGMIMKRIRVVLKFLPNEEAKVARLVDRMFFDPELARHLLTKAPKAIEAPGWSGKLNRLLAVGHGVREAVEE